MVLKISQCTLYNHMHAASAAAKLLQSCLTLFDPIDGSPPASPIPGILQARTLEWVAISFSSAWKWKVKSESEVAQSCPTLSDPMDCSLSGKNTGVVCHFLLQGIFLTQGLNLRILLGRQIPYHWSHQGSQLYGHGSNIYDMEIGTHYKSRLLPSPLRASR